MFEYDLTYWYKNNSGALFLETSLPRSLTLGLMKVCKTIGADYEVNAIEKQSSPYVCKGWVCVGKRPGDAIIDVSNAKRDASGRYWVPQKLWDSWRTKYRR